MANIILIDEDDRVRKQAETFLRELGDENRIRTFKSLKEFEQLYFRIKQDEKPKPPFVGHPTLGQLVQEQQEWILKQTLSAEVPFPQSPLRFMYDKESLKAKNLDPQPGDKAQILGTAHTDFVTQEKVLENLLPVNFQHNYSELLAQLESSDKAEALLCFYSPKNEIWLIKLSINKTEQGLQFQMENLNASLKEAIASKKTKQSNEDEEDEDELRLLSDIDLFIVKSTLLPKKPITWIDAFHANIKKFKLNPEKFRTRLVLFKYEDDGMGKVDLMHPGLDDIIFLPLDRLIFLQKVEIILGYPGKISPSFLFTQEAEMEIQIAKRSWMEKLSDVALAIRNPVPLVAGLMGHFYIDLLGEKESLEVLGKVIYSEPHPNYPNEFLVYFSFFGLKKEAQTRIRKFLSKESRYASLLDDDKENFLFNSDNLFLSDEERRQKNIIVVDSDPDSYSQALDILKEDMDHIQVAAFSSYSAFLRKYFEDKGSTLDVNDLSPVNLKELSGGQIAWIINPDNHELVEATPFSPDTTVLGYSFDELFKEKKDWEKLIISNGNESLLEEAIQLVLTGRPFQTLFFSLDKEMKQKALNLKVNSHSRGLQLSLSIPKPEEVKEFILLQSKFTQWDLLILDSALMPDTIDDWIKNMETNARSNGYLKENQNLKIILIDHSDSRRDKEQFKQTHIRSLLLRPLEPRSFVFNVSSALDHPHTVYSFKNMGWSTSRTPVQVAKKAQLKRLSEFGAELQLPRPIAPGSFLFLRDSIFDNAPRSNLCARFYACEEDPTEKGQFLCSLIYFGINEAFTKFARSWFRETYAASKQNEN